MHHRLVCEGSWQGVLSQLTLGERWGTPWTRWQFITGLTFTDKESTHTRMHTPKDNCGVTSSTVFEDTVPTFPEIRHQYCTRYTVQNRIKKCFLFCFDFVICIRKKNHTFIFLLLQYAFLKLWNVFLCYFLSTKCSISLRPSLFSSRGWLREDVPPRSSCHHAHSWSAEGELQPRPQGGTPWPKA